MFQPHITDPNTHNCGIKLNGSAFIEIISKQIEPQQYVELKKTTHGAKD